MSRPPSLIAPLTQPRTCSECGASAAEWHGCTRADCGELVPALTAQDFIAHGWSPDDAAELAGLDAELRMRDSGRYVAKYIAKVAA